LNGTPDSISIGFQSGAVHQTANTKCKLSMPVLARAVMEPAVEPFQSRPRCEGDSGGGDWPLQLREWVYRVLCGRFTSLYRGWSSGFARFDSIDPEADAI
jgi:hypothetical protein